MKKSTLAVGIVAILGIGYVGTSWYTGNVIESGINQKLEQIVQEANEYQDEVNVAIKYDNYQKNVFSTQMHVTITLSDKKYPEDQTTVFNDDITIHHGPFPLSALAKGKFSPQMAWVEYAMTEKASPELWKLAGNKPFITAYAGMSYQEYLTIKLTNRAVSATSAELSSLNGKFDISAGELSFEANQDFSSLFVDAHLDKWNYSDNTTNNISFNKFNLTAKPNTEKTGIVYELNVADLSATAEDYHSTPSVTLNNIQSQGLVVYSNENIEAKTSVDKFTFVADVKKLDKSPPIVINQLVVDQKINYNQEMPNTLDGSLVTNVGSLLVGQQNLGSGTLNFDYQGVDESLVTRSLGGYSYQDDKEINADDPVKMTLSLNKFNWHNESGDINANFLFALSGIRKEVVQANVDHLDVVKLQLDVPFNVLAHIVAQTSNPQSNTVTEDEVSKANQSIQMMSAMFLRSSPVMTFKKGEVDGIFADVNYMKGDEEVEVNGQKVNKELFFENF